MIHDTRSAATARSAATNPQPEGGGGSRARVLLVLATLVTLAWIAFVAGRYYLALHGPRTLMAAVLAQAPDLARPFQGIPGHGLELAEAAAFMIAALAAGDWLLERVGFAFEHVAERVAFGGGSGLMIAATLTLALGCLGLLYRPIVVALLLAGLALAGWRSRHLAGPARSWWWIRSRPPSWWRLDSTGIFAALLTALVAYVLYAGFLLASLPDQVTDSLDYHLASARLYAYFHRIVNLIPSFGMWRSQLPANQEMLFTATYLLQDSGSTVARLVTVGEGGLFCLAMIAASQSLLGRALPGLAAGAAFLCAPTVISELGSGLVDIGLVLFSTLTFLALLRWYRAGGAPWLVLAGAFAGFAYGIKQEGAFVAVAAGLLILPLALSRRGTMAASPRQAPSQVVRAMLLFGGSVLALALPWLLKATLFTGNPTYPFLDSVFHSRFWSAHAQQTVLAPLYTQYGVGRGLLPTVGVLWNLTFENNAFGGQVGPTFLCLAPLVPILVWVNRRRLGSAAIPILALWVAGHLLLLVWVLTISEARFAFPALAVLIAAASCAANAPGSGRARAIGVAVCVVVVVQAFLNLPGFGAWNAPVAGATIGWRETNLRPAFGQESEAAALTRSPGADYWLPWPVIQYINTSLASRGPRIYVAGPPVLPYYYLDPRVSLVATTDILFYAGGPIDLNAPDAPARLRAAGVTELYVDRLTFERLLVDPRYARRIEVLTMTTGPANDYWYTPMRLVRLLDQA